MKKLVLVLLAAVFSSTLLQGKEPSKPADFSGNWVLNFSETKNPPAGLEGYSMVVSQNQQQLKVQTTLQGDLQPEQGGQNPGSYPGGSGGGYPGRRGGMGRGGIGLPGIGGIGWPGGGGMPGGGIPGGGSGRPSGEGRSRGSLAAYKLYPQNAVFMLDGSASTVQLGDPEQTGATSRAEWAKGGGELKLSLVGNGASGQRGDSIQLKDEWKLSEDGKSLRVDRSIKSPEGSGTVHLVFFKQEGGPGSSAR